MHPAALSDWVPHFVRASNRLAGIDRDPTATEISAHRGLLAANKLRVENLEQFVRHVAGGARLREAASDGAACPADADLRADLETIVEAASARAASPARVYRIYRLLRPFTDGNGRCARALLMWQVMRQGPPRRGVMRAAASARARPRTARPLCAPAVI
jgi:hypothetical protein